MNITFPITGKCCHVGIAKKIEKTTLKAKYCYEKYLYKDEKVLTSLVGAGAAIAAGMAFPPVGILIGLFSFLNILDSVPMDCQNFIDMIFR